MWPVAPGGSCPFAGNRTSSASEDELYDGGGAIHLGHVRMYKAKENTKSRNYPEKIFLKNSCLEESDYFLCWVSCNDGNDQALHLQLKVAYANNMIIFHRRNAMFLVRCSEKLRTLSSTIVDQQ